MLPPTVRQNAASKRWERTASTPNTALSQDMRKPASHNKQHPSVNVARRQCSVAKNPAAATSPNTNKTTPIRCKRTGKGAGSK